jgi:DNA polymerase III subunit chi
MSRVDFYVLAQAGPQYRHSFACRLAEKAYRLDHSVLILAPNTADAERLDELLWTFRDGSFVPHHRIATATRDLDSPVTIGCEDDPVPAGDLLINLCDEIPACAESFPRVAELVTSDEECRQKSRKRFTAYRDRGHTLETHKV